MEQESEKDPVHRSRKKRFIPLNHTQRHSTLTGIAKDHLASWRSYLHTCGKEEGEKKEYIVWECIWYTFFFHLTCLVSFWEILGHIFSAFVFLLVCLFVFIGPMHVYLVCLYVISFSFMLLKKILCVCLSLEYLQIIVLISISSVF